MKRFTETTKWDDAWYRKLSPPAKLLWSYLTDKCNCVGLLDLDLEAASFHIGSTIDNAHLTELGSRVFKTTDGKLFIPKFIDFQYGQLSPTCPAHKPVFKAIEFYGLVKNGIGYQYPISRVSNTYRKGKGKEKDKEGVQGETEATTILQYLNLKTGREFKPSKSSLAPINARLLEGTVEGIKKMIDRQCARWMGTRFEEYLRPSTLFAPEKFNEYYAARDIPLPINGEVRTKSLMEKELEHL